MKDLLEALLEAAAEYRLEDMEERIIKGINTPNIRLYTHDLIEILQSAIYERKGEKNNGT